MAWSTSPRFITVLDAVGFGAGCDLAIALREVAGNGFTVLTGRYACGADAWLRLCRTGLGNDTGGAACGGCLALRASALAFLAAWGLSVAAGLLAIRCWVARCCWYVANARHVVA